MQLFKKKHAKVPIMLNLYMILTQWMILSNNEINCPAMQGFSNSFKGCGGDGNFAEEVDYFVGDGNFMRSSFDHSNLF